MSRPPIHSRLWLLVCLLAGLLSPGILQAAEVIMKNGHSIAFVGKPIPLQGLTLEQRRHSSSSAVEHYAFTMFDAISRRYYVAQSQVGEIQLGDRYTEEFALKVRPAQQNTMFSTVGGFTHVEPFSDYGRRIVSLQGPDKQIDIVQVISKIRPDYVELTSLSFNWQYSVATETLPPQILRKTLSQTIDEKNIDDRLAVVRFFVNAQLYQEAQHELDRMAVDFEKAPDFPSLKKKLDELHLEIRQLRALQFSNEFQRRLAVGQYELVQQMAGRFPRQDVNAATLMQIDKILHDHQVALEHIDQIRAELSRLQAEVKAPELLQRFQDMRSVVDKRLSRHTLERLVPFHQNIDDNSLKPEEKLALAYSAWVVGPALADTDAQTAIHYWDARDCVLEFLRTQNPVRRSELLLQLRSIEDIGPRIVTALVKHLGPWLETSAGNAGELLHLETAGSSPVKYRVLLPMEYSPDRQYPVVLALHAGGLPPEQALEWWGGAAPGGPAHRNGYIVIAPEYQPLPASDETTTNSAIRVMQVLRDARKRLGMDSNRVLLAGHGQGGDAAFEIGMAHPDQFCGVVVITGRTNDYARHYWENTRQLPFYVVSGELDGDSFKHNSDVMTRMMRNRFDVILTEFKQRGREDYQEELPHILDWMRLQERDKLPTELEVKTMRPEHNRFHWLEFHGLPEQILQPRLNRQGNPMPAKALPISAKITAGNSLFITAGVDRISLWLTPDLVSFEDRLKVVWKGKTVYNDIPEADIQTMLEHLQVTGDRDRLYWKRLDF